jgi:hypothetical protein
MGCVILLIFCCLFNIVTDPANILGQMFLIIIFICGLFAIYEEHLKIIERRDQWRDQRFWAWIMKDLPGPEESNLDALIRPESARGLWQIRSGSARTTRY